MRRKTIDIKEALTYFFASPNWQKTSGIYFGVILAIGAIVTVIVVAFILLATVIGENLILTYMMVAIGVILYFVMIVLFQSYIMGYTVEIVDNTSSEGPYYDFDLFAEPKKKLIEGFKPAVANFIYTLPLILISNTPAIIIMATTAVGEQPSGEMSILNMLFGLVGGFGILLIMTLWQPAVLVNFSNNKTWKSVFDFSAIFKIVSKNFTNLLMIALGYFAAGVIFFVAYIVSYLSIFLCIGIILLPVVVTVGSVWVFHVYANLVGQLKVIDES